MSAVPPVDAFAALRQFTRRKKNVERCELCSAEVSPHHPHLIETAKRKILCTCDACAILFSGMGLKYKRVPRRVLSMPNFQLSSSQWESLMVPISMAFFFRSTPENRVLAFYPSPAGPTESQLPLDTWKDIEAVNPVLQSMEADVEALLVNRVGYARGVAEPEYFVIPVDECYKLVGLIRAHWRGLSGGTEVWQEIGKFFADLKDRATVVREEANA